MKIFVLVFGGIGTILLLIGGLVFYNEQKFLETAEVVNGTVTDYNLSSSTDGGSSYCPVIEFTTKKGEPVKYYANVCSSPPSYDIGEQVEVLYDPADIRNVQMNGFWSKYTGVIVLSCIGLPFFLLGVWGLFAGRKKPDKKSA
jgi:hypothetical protein